ncbi:MAG: hypothetical protein ACREM8_11660, partial [Vulcanimicrobiaceae bacterium]
TDFTIASVGVCRYVGPTVAGALADYFGPATVSVFAAATYAVSAAAAAMDALVGRPRSAVHSVAPEAAPAVCGQTSRK